MSKGSVAEKNRAMAAYLKERGVRRTSGRCPVCNKVIGINALQGHIATACRSN